MSEIAIKVENLSKSYLLGHNKNRREKYVALREVITRNTKSLFRKTLDVLQGKAIIQGDEVEELWALKNISFEIKKGERIGIIGHNGAGKSTLLKILSRITEPTHGRILVNGRIASLLEIGTGFHPELSGRENIFLNGAILGMSKTEIRRKFDEIVEFAEIEKHLDTPVKRYSSGMYVRLGFSVAAHLNSEILIVDEVLSVGDVQFQEKCFGTIKSASNEGRTIVFVSHDMLAISSLCQKAITLNHGFVDSFDTTSIAIKSYLQSDKKPKNNTWNSGYENEYIELRYAQIESSSGQQFTTEHALLAKITVRIKTPIIGLIIGWELRNTYGQILAYSLFDDSQPPPAQTTQPGLYSLTMEIPGNTLSAGEYNLALDLGIHNMRRLVPESTVSFTFQLTNTAGIGRRYPNNLKNTFRPQWVWHNETSRDNAAHCEPNQKNNHQHTSECHVK